MWDAASPRSTLQTLFQNGAVVKFSKWFHVVRGERMLMFYTNCARIRMFWSLEARELNCFSPNIIKNNFGRTSVKRAYNFDMWSWRKWATARSACPECVSKFRNLGKSVFLLSKNMDIYNVKQYLTAICGLNNEAFRKYKTLRLWEHREVVHSLSLRFKLVFLLILSFSKMYLRCIQVDREIYHSFSKSKRCFNVLITQIQWKQNERYFLLIALLWHKFIITQSMTQTKQSLFIYVVIKRNSAEPLY